MAVVLRISPHISATILGKVSGLSRVKSVSGLSRYFYICWQWLNLMGMIIFDTLPNNYIANILWK